MDIKLEVIASSSIKRNKPWPKIEWVGQEHESLLMIDNEFHRISVLYVPSGKTKKKLPRLTNLVDSTICVGTTRDGAYLIGLTHHGDIFFWHKDRDILKTIRGLAGIVSSEELQHEPCRLFASADCQYFLLVIGTHNFFVWKTEQSEDILESKLPEVQGSWNKIAIPNNLNVPMSYQDCAECSVDAVFFNHQSLGNCCQMSIVFNKEQSLCVISLLLRFGTAAEFYSSKSAPFQVEWTVIQYPFKHIHPSYEPIQSKGAYVNCYANNGQVVAVAANQNTPGHSSMLFVSPLTDTVMVSEMKGCGVRDRYSKMGSMYWLREMMWTCDDLFLACIMNSGAVCLLSRLGEPMYIRTFGQSIELGPANFLPLHPCQYVSKMDDNKSSPVHQPNTNEDPMRQRFSVSTHPSLPIILFSDGFMVTIAQTPADMTCLTLMRDFVLFSSKHLKDMTKHENLDLTVADAYGMPSSREEKSARSARDRKRRIQFEVPDGSLNTTQESETSFLDEQQDMFQGLTAGKIAFAETEIPVIDPTDLSGLDQLSTMSKQLDIAENCLFSAWKLTVSYYEPWTADAENVAKIICKNLTKLFVVLLECPVVDKVLMEYRKVSPSAQNPRLSTLINMYRKCMELLRFDIINQHLMPVTLRYSHHTLNLVLNSSELQKTDPRLKTLSGCYALMKFTETILNRVYVWVPKDMCSGLPPESRNEQKHTYEPAILVKSQLSPRSAAKEITTRSQSETKGVVLDQQSQLPSRRLCASWKLLYKSMVQHHTQLQGTDGQQKQAEQLGGLIYTVQQTIQEVEGEVVKPPTPRVNQGDKLSMDGEHTMAIDAWIAQLSKMSDRPEDVQQMSRVLHSVLYTYIIKGQLARALDFVDSLVIQAKVSTSVNEQEDRSLMMTIVTHSLKKSLDKNQMVPCIRNRCIRQLVQTLARFMAAYFSNQTIYVFPPHNPQSLPVIHMGTVQISNRILPKYHEDITNLVRQEGLSQMWTTERVLEYLLLSGLVCEAVWFADKMGDWKAAFLLSVACTSHHIVAPRLYKKKKRPLMLPDELSPAAILRGKLEALIHVDKRKTGATVKREEKRVTDFIPIDNETNLGQLTRTVGDILTAGIISDVEIVPWLLSSLVDRLKHVVSNFPPLVPKDFYLPAPPVYCPQPSDSDKETGGSPEAQREKRLRFQISSLVQLILVIMEASNISLPSARWYIQELTKAQSKAQQFKATTEGPCLELPEVLEKYKQRKSGFSKMQKERSVRQVVNSFRDFCTILWLLHARDKLSKLLRQREERMNDVKYEDYMRESWESKEGESWVKECFTNLQWAVHMAAFSRFLPDEGCVYKIILSLLLELPPNEDTADILAEFFYDPDNLDAEVQEKLDKLLAVWQGVFIEPEDDGKSARPDTSIDNNNDDENEGRKSVTFLQVSPRGKILSVYYFKQCEVVMKVLKKRAKVFGRFEEFVYDRSGKINKTDSLKSNGHRSKNGFHIGCRPFETKTSYLEFLDSFFDISFTKILDTDTDQHKSLPLLLPFSEEICARQFRAMDEKSGTTMHSRQCLVPMTPPHRPVKRTQSESVLQYKGAKINTGFYRSVSAVESHTQADNLSEPPSARPQPSPRGNMTDLASKFAQSEDALYKDSAAQEDSGLFLDVDFGTKYHHVQNLLDWLSHWGNKNHALGLNWKREKDLEFRPTMKINVPPTLVVLALWLVENKYTPSKKPTRAGHSSEGQNLSVIEEDTARTNRTEFEEAVIQQTQVKQVEALTGSRRSSQDKRSPNRQELGMSSSMRSFSSHHTENEYDLETEEVHTAYERVLDGDKEESSSLEVSSLGTDEYEPEMRQTLSIIRGSKTSPQRSRRSLRHTSPDYNLSYLNRIHNFQSPDRHNQHSPNTSTPKTQRSMRRTGSPRTRSTRGGNQAEMVGDLASQLQGIVRSELRRIMEVQHTNMMAMMGALDDEDYSQAPPPRRYPRRPHSQSPSRGERRVMENRATSPIRVSRGNSLDRSTMRIEELEHSGRSRSAKKGSVRGALSELKNLQDSANQSRAMSGSRSPPRTRVQVPDRKTEVKENIYPQHSQQLSNEPIHFIPKFLRIPAERDLNEDQVKLPKIPSQAWRENDDEYAEKPTENINIPLLNVHGAHVPSRLFPGVNRFPGEQIPPYGPPPQYFESHSDERSSDQSIGIPLLKMPNETKPFLGPRPEPSFGRLLAPHLILGSEQERHQQEMAKQKYAQEFHRQQVENLEELEKQRFGENMLHINLKHQELKERKEEEAKARKRKQKNRVVMSRSESPTESESRRSRTPRKTVTPRKVITPRKAVTPRDRSTAGEEEEEEEYYEEEQSTDVAETGEEIDETLEEEEEPDKLYDGYAIKPGSFDNYLELDEKLGPEADTNARIQYRTAMILKKQRQKRKKVDFSTNTTEYADMGTDADEAFESVRTAEAATSITKDTGVDPIQEAIVEYNRARQGSALPPDIYLGLRFGDGENQPTSDVAPDGKQVKPKGRSYLNVVDLDAAAVLKDLRAIRDEEKVQEDLSLRPTSETLMSARGHQQGQEFTNLEASLRESLRPRSPVRPFKQDAVTVSMFQQRGGPTGERVSVAVMPRDSVVDTRAGIIQRLRDMNSQALAIDQMSTKIEREFQSTHMMLDTLENLVDAEEPQERDRSLSPSGKVSARSGPASARSRSPGSKVSHRSPQATARSGSLSPGPKMSHRSPEVTARSTARSAKTASQRSQRGGSPDLVAVSGLSGISDIIGDMVQRGEIDLEDAGYTPKEAEEFARKVKLSVRSGQSPDRELLQRSLELLEKMGEKAKYGKENEDAERKEEIRAWMQEKRTARQEEYLRKLAELREHEHNPFKPRQDTSFRGPANELKKDRQTTGKENMDRRLEDAQSLIADIITDKPKLPKQVPLRETSPKRSRVSQARMDYSPHRKTVTLSPAQSRRQVSPKRQPVQHSPDRREVSPKRQTVTITTDMPTEYRPGVTQSSRRIAHDDLPANPVKRRQGIMKPSRDYSPPEVTQGHPGVPRLQLIDSGEILHKSMETTGGEISAYAKAVEAMEVTKSDDMFMSERLAPSPEPEPRKYKPKPFHKMVRVQRPELTRKYRESKVAPVVTEADIRDYHDDDQTTTRSWNESKELTIEEKQKIYGSKRMPAPSRIPVASPRTVKTYTERLQEMKSKQPAFTQPIMPRSHRPGGGSVRSSQITSVSRRKTGPPHKPLSYVERLQKLNEGTHKPRATTGRVKTATFMRSHKPIHKPQTYAEQLQSLQPKPVKKMAPARGQTRIRPYADPYRTGVPDERDSVISDWSMDDDVKRLLYEDDASSAMPGQSIDHPMSRMSGMDYPMSEGVSDYYDVIMDSNEYVESVDIDEINKIAYAASVSSGSVMSVIDWDAIDNLISDVK